MGAETSEIRSDQGIEDVFTNLLEGYRFTVCETQEEVAEALEVRCRVYADAGYAIPIPDEYDHRSWHLRAEEVSTGRCVGTMRITPRLMGSFEAEEYFTLPAELRGPRCFEITRFAILPEHRRDRTQIPGVAFGLFRLCYDVATTAGGTVGVVCSKASRAWTYTSMGFDPTGLVAAYEKLNGAEHEVLAVDFTDAHEFLRDNPFRTLFLDMTFPEVIVPNRRPPLGLVPDTREFRYAVGA